MKIFQLIIICIVLFSPIIGFLAVVLHVYFNLKDKSTIPEEE